MENARIKGGDNPSVIASTFGLYYETKFFVDRQRSGRPKLVCTESLIRSVKAKIDKNPLDNIFQMSRDLRVHKMSVRRIVNDDLGLKSRVVTKVQGLTALHRLKRLEQSKILLNILKKPNRKVLIFSEEKNYTVDPVSNSRSLLYIAKIPKDAPPEVKFTGRSKHPANAMMFVVIGSDGKAFPLVWIKGTVKANEYKIILAMKVFPALNVTYSIGYEHRIEPRAKLPK
ncbi:uncharacterized protein [Lepeophtheirus salmonis]|uniref:uncharacterized protein n=1 Tax=Lepeophtheirus salmonis TaxID=72036 RepID=UPI003AF3E4C7